MTTNVRKPPPNISDRGFTLIELMVTLLILALLASTAVPMTQIAFKRHKEEELRRALVTIRDALDNYKKATDEGRIDKGASDSGYPAALGMLVTGVVDTTSPAPKKLYFLRRIPRDPFATDPDDSNDTTWGKRSYESEADDPKEGVDIYDIYSRSSDVGLNGIPYREW